MMYAGYGAEHKAVKLANVRSDEMPDNDLC